MTVATPARSPLQDRLAAARRANAGTRHAIARAATDDGTAPLSPAQARLWFLGQLEPGSCAYNAPTVLRLRGALDAAALLAALRDLAERHPVLRSVVGERDGAPVAVELPAAAVPLALLDVAAEGLPAALRAETERPFALDAEPPMRAAVLRLRDDEHVLVLTLHHIATDAWSHNLLLADLAALYAARLGLADAPGPPALRYGDYAAWLAAGHENAAAAVDWWADRLAGLAPLLDLPADRPRPAAADWSAAEVPLTLPAPLAGRLRAVAAEQRCTPFMVLLAAWQALLARICGTDDVPVAVPESGRRHAATEGIVGCFINTVIVRTDTSGDPTGRELIGRVRDGALESFAHAAAPFEQVVARINPDRAVGATPLAQVQLNVFDEPAAPRFAGLDAEQHEAAPETAKTDLSMTLVDGGTAFQGGLVYRRALFDERSAARIAGWYVHLLEGMLADVDRPVGAVPLEPLAGPLLAGPARPWPVERPVHALFEQRADADPGATAVVAADGTLTYGELERGANRLAHRLRAAGVEPDEPVGVLLEPSTALACALLGIQKAGGGYLPMDTTYPAGRIAAILDAAGARTLLTTAELADRGAGRTVLALDDPATLAGQPETRPADTAGPDRLAHVIFTSGSTGAPKGVAVSRRSVASYLHGVLERLGDVGGGSFAMVSTPAADFGLTPVFGALTTGGCVHLVDREVATDPAAFARYLAEHRVDVLKCVPSHLELLAAHGALADVLPRRLLILAGEACPWSLVERVRDARPQLRVQNHYGHTESTMISLVCEVDEVPPERRSGVVPLGAALANVTGFVVDRAGRPLPAGVPGELVVSGPGIARGYVGRPDLTAERFVPDPQDGTRRCYRSGDRIVVRADGTVDFLGRVDDQVKIRGYRVEPGEVVVALRALPEVDEAVVLPVGEGGARKLAAWLVGTDVDVASVRARLRERLPDYMVPASFAVLDRLPLTPNGKVDRAALPAPETDRPAGLTAPSSPAEQRVAAAWAAVLGLQEIGAEDDFFALGGDSFAAVRAVRAIDPGLRVIDLFTHPTVRGLGAFLDARDAAPSGDRGLLHRLGGPPAGVTPVATLVGVPYGGGSAAAFQPLAAPLAERGIALLAVELPGHDPARPDEAPLGLAELVDRLAAEVAERVTGPIALYGHCVGSALATALGRRLEADGRQVLGVVAAGSFPAARLPGRLSAWAGRVFGERWVSDRLYRDALRATGGLLDDMDEAATEVALRSMRHDAHEAEEWFGRELAAPAGPRLEAPILCLVGERDRLTELYQERHREWGAFAERVELATVPQAGHYFLRHQAAAVAETLAGRLSDWAAGRLPAVVRDVPVDSRGLRAFYTVAGGQLVSNIGSALTAFALGVWAYQRSGRIIDLALVIMLAQLPVVLVTPLGGALADRLDRRRIMLAADAVAGLATLALVALLATGRLALWNACVVVTVIAVVTALQQPAWLAAISQLVPKPYLPQANALANLGISLGAVVAPLAGGVLIATLGLSAVVAVDVVTFGAGIVTLLLVRFPDRLVRTREESFRTALGGGWRFIVRRRPLVVMVVFVAAANYFNAVLWVATAPLVLSFAGPAALGVVTAVGGVGAALGGAAVLVWGGTRRRATGMVGFVVGSGLGAVLMGLWPSVILVAIGLAVRWGSMAIGNAHWLSLIQVKVGQELQGRVLAANLMLAAAMEPLGFLTADPLAGLMSHAPGVGPGRGVAALVVVCGIFLTVWGLLGLRYRPLRHMEDALPDAVPDAEIDSDLDRVQARADLAWAV